MMNFRLAEAIEILERTPGTLASMLSGLSDGWLKCDDGEDTWNAEEVVEHMIEAERHNWIPRLQHLLQSGERMPFPEFDRFAHLQRPSRGIDERLRELAKFRAENIELLQQLIETDATLEQTGSHPAFGTVTCRELVSTWVVHDLTHIAQIVRVIAKRYRTDVGPWIEYLTVLRT